uniref:glycogenin glucosyltransferase n=1 Tax=Anopheles christyi TaxID=43041 RepID=A0A182JT37_9DIPT
MSKYAWVTLATNDSYSLGALVVAYSLKRVHTEHQMVVLITPGVSESMKTKLRTVFNLVEEVNLLDSKDEANLALLKRPELGVTFTKLHCWRLTQFEKCVFLDADTLVLRNCDELFEREELSAAPDIGWPDCFNSGVYVYTPNMETFSKLVQYAVTHGSFDGGDQGLLNAYFSDWAHKDIQKHLPFIYNTSSVATFGQNTKILHFIGVAKPWLQNFNSETRKVYVPSECQHLANFLQYWWDIFADDVHSRLSPDMSGLAGALANVTLGAPRTSEQDRIEEKLRRQYWEAGNAEYSGIAGALAQLHLGEAKSQEQEAYEEHMRRQCWETGNIDYMGRDSFDNIWKRIQQTINTGTGQYAEETSEPPVAQTTAPATTPRKSRRPSRSRSATPKRDPKDRSPTPQPEEKIPVDKKEGYQQIITTKSPDGKTRTHTKLVYDPSIEDDQAQEEKTEQLTASTVATNQDVADGTMIQKVKVNTPSVSSEQKSRTASTAGAVPKIASPKMVVPPTNPYPETNSGDNYSQSAIPKSSSKPAVPSIAQQPQQQVAQESLAGKTNAFFESKQPIKALRKKRHISPSPQPLQTANATSNDSTPGKAPSSSSSSSSAINALPHGVPSNQKAAITTPTCPSAVSPSSTASSSKADSRYTHNTLHSRAPLNNAKDESTLTLPSLEKTLTPSPQSSSLSKSSIEVGSPPVPPRRKRESRTAKLDTD